MPVMDACLVFNSGCVVDTLPIEPSLQPWHYSLKDDY
jgi:hypothetical protein